MKAKEIQQEALGRALNGQTFSNYPYIIKGFVAKGLSEDDIKPRENVFSYDAWQALKRHVRKGEHGVRIFTFIKTDKVEIDSNTGEEKTSHRSMPTGVTVFHISQTDPNG